MTPAAELPLWPYQQHDVGRVRDLQRSGCKRILLVQPTGAGKGFQAAWMIRRIVRNGGTVMFLVNRRGLVEDMSERVTGMGIEHGVIMSGHKMYFPRRPVQVASLQTIARRPIAPPADVLFLDEAHFAVTDQWSEVIDRYPDADVIGMTATPIRKDGKGLGRIFQEMVVGPSIATLQDMGYLVRTKLYCPDKPDMKKVKKTFGEYDEAQTGSLMMGDSGGKYITGNIVEHWLKINSGQPTVGFAVHRAHSQQIRDEFLKQGVRCIDVDANTKNRGDIWEKLDNGGYQVVMSVGIISYGWNRPKVAHAIDACPSGSLAAVLQKYGRVLRISDGKEYAIISDHAGNYGRHGRVEDEREWSLADGLVVEPGAKKEKALAVRECEACWYIYPANENKCPECGAPYSNSKNEIVTKDGSLQEVKAPDRWYLCEECHTRFSIPYDQPGKPCCAHCYGHVLKRLAGKYDTGMDATALYLRLVREGALCGHKEGWPGVQLYMRVKKRPTRAMLDAAKPVLEAAQAERAAKLERKRREFEGRV